MNQNNSIENMINLLLLTASRLQSYVDDGIPINDSYLIVDDDGRIDSAERRIRDYRNRIEKDRELIKRIRKIANRRKQSTSKNFHM